MKGAVAELFPGRETFGGHVPDCCRALAEPEPRIQRSQESELWMLVAGCWMLVRSGPGAKLMDPDMGYYSRAKMLVSTDYTE
jgi:hypothetical protein